ncbi:MAG: GNAT family N-acetyltransferase [Nitratireductor sp.]
MPEPDIAVTAFGLGPLDPDSVDAVARRLAAIDPWLRMGFSANGLAGYLTRDDPAAMRVSLEWNGEMAGVAVMRRPWLRGPYLEMLCVFPEASGLGIGSRFLSWFEAHARERNERNLWVAVSDFNLSAIRFYERAGFVQAVALPGLVGDAFTELLLRKQLTP